jgi:hypothetical protein
MKRIFTLLLISLFFLNAFSQANVEVFRGTTNIKGNTINVLAGQNLTLKVTITEPVSDSAYFKTGASKQLDLVAPNGFFVNPPTGIDYSAVKKANGNASIDVNNIVNGDVFFDDSETNTDAITQKVTVNAGGNSQDSIIISNIKINIPTDISQGDYVLYLENDFIGDEDSIALLTFYYEKPVISVTPIAKACYNENVECTVAITNTNLPNDFEYELFVGNSQRGSIVVSKASPYTGNFSRDAIVTVRDIEASISDPNAGSARISNEETIAGSTFFKGIGITLESGEICAGTEASFNITLGGCSPDSVVIEFSEGTTNIFNRIKSILGGGIDPNSHDFTATIDEIGEVKAIAYYDGDAIESNPVTVNNILILEDTYSLQQGLRVPSKLGEINLFNKLSPSFSSDSTQVLPIDVYGTDKTDLVYFTNNYSVSGDYTFGRFHLEYNDSDTASDSNVFDTENPGVTTSSNDKNEVTFHYGKYFSAYTKYCYSKTETEINVVSNKVFIPEESYCSYDDRDIGFSIDIENIPVIDVEDGYGTTAEFYQYKITDASNNVLQSGLTTEDTFNPSTLWSGNENSDFVLINISAIAKGGIYQLPQSCPDQWQEFTGGSNIIYTVGDEVSRYGKEYRCIQDATADNAPSESSDYWNYVGDCDKIYYENPDGGGGYQVLQNETKQTDEPILEEKYIEPIGLWYWDCDYDSWTMYGNPQPNYEHDDSVTFGENIYVCEALYAYPDDIPGSSSVWRNTGLTCNVTSDTISVNYSFASTSFYIYKPKSDGQFLNLDDSYGVSNKVIDLSCNYTIQNVENHNGSIVKNANDVWQFIPEDILVGNIKKDSVLIKLTYVDDNACVDTNRFWVRVGEEYVTRPTFTLEDWDSSFCKINSDYKLISNHKIELAEGPGISTLTNGNFAFNPFNAHEEPTVNYNEHFFIWLDYRVDYNKFEDSLELIIHPQPIIDNYTVNNVCIGDSVNFNVNTSFDIDTEELKWFWDFGDNDTISHKGVINNEDDVLNSINTGGTYPKPVHKYSLAGEYNAIFKLSTDENCFISDTFNIVVGSYPKVDFTADGFKIDSATHFHNLSTDAPFDTVKTYTWQFGSDPSTEIMFEEFDHTFASHGVHNVSLTATSENNCSTTDSIKVPIFNLVTVTSDNTYQALFNDSEEDWILSHRYMENLPSGWEYNAIAPPFNGEVDTDNMIWQTGEPADEITNENSWVESPTFDINGLDFPLLSMDIYESVEVGSDGAAIQYTWNDGDSWNLLGDEGVGVNWYDTRGIVSDPGGQGTGWSLNEKEWKTARFSLDDLKKEMTDTGATQVRFRVAYASNDGNAPNIDVQGFAFDNFTLSSRNRVVLVEQFVNSVHSKSIQEQEETWLDDFVNTRKSEVVDMRYHNKISHDMDPLFEINKPDISSRSMEYGATQNQLTMVDGIGRFVASESVSAETDAGLYYKERTLTDVGFDIDVTHFVNGDNLEITADITKEKEDLLSVGSQKCVVRMAIVQHEYEGFNNVVVELLPNGEGNVVATIPADFAKDETITVNGTWTPSVTNVTTNGNEFRLVVYVQGIWGVDEVHQVWFEDSIAVPGFTAKTVSGSEKSGENNSFVIYPSPVKEKLNISWYETLQNPIQWKLITMSGMVVKQGTTPAGNIREEIDTYQMNKGIYLLLTEDLTTMEVEQRKILIVK